MDTAQKTFPWSLAVLLVLVTVVALVAWTPARATMDHAASTDMQPDSKILSAASSPKNNEADDVVAAAATLTQSEPEPVALTPDTDGLVRYLNDSMRAWTSLPSEGSDPPDAARAAKNAESRTRLASTAADIVTVVRSEPPLFEGDADLSKSSVLVATVAFFESAFAEYVDSGKCNDYAWRRPSTVGPSAVSRDEVNRRRALLAAGGCDGGYAYSDWQIHPFDGFWRDGIALLDGSRAWAFAYDLHDGEQHEVVRGRDMIADRQKAARVALHMLRRALGMSGGTNLCGYTGERGDCPKGAKRLKFAIDWSRKHPFHDGAPGME